MNADPFGPFFDSQDVVLLDGGLATELEVRGFDLADALWSARLLIEQPEAIRELHYDYLKAGADVITSASYQATVQGFGRRGLAPSEAEDLLQLSVALARQARDKFWNRPEHRLGRQRPLVAASVGPYGAYLADGSEYTGDYRLSAEADAGGHLMAFHRRRLEILIDAGPDLLACETVPCQVEARALARLLEETEGPPAWMSFCCRDDQHLSDGGQLTAAVEAVQRVERIVAIGINCTAPHHLPGLILRLRSATQKPIVVYPNSGEAWDAEAKRWLDRPEEMALGNATIAWHRAGARLIGGCCRIGPSDIGRMRARLLDELPAQQNAG